MFANFPEVEFCKDCNKVQEEKKDVDVLRSRPQQNVKVGTFTS